MGLTTPIEALFAYTCAFIYTPFLLSRFVFDLLLYILPWTRPDKRWSFNQAVRMRVVRLVLLYWSLLRAGDRLTLNPSRERNRFEVIPPRSPKLYRGILADPTIQPKALGVTWTPARPPPAAIVRPEMKVALHFHGGGFVVGNGRDEDTGFTARTLIRHMDCTHVCTPQYRLSSSKQGWFPAQIQDALTVYLCLLKEKSISSNQIILSGDSAGGNIALGLLRYIHEYGAEDGIPAPGGVALWSPWVDVHGALHQDLQLSPNYKADYLNKEFGRWGASTVSAHGSIDPSGPYLSPLHDPFTLGAGIPMFIHAGEREVLCDDIKNFSQRYQKAGWKVHLTVSKGCPHDIILIGERIGFAKDAEEAARAARGFLFGNTGGIHISEVLCRNFSPSILPNTRLLIGRVTFQLCFTSYAVSTYRELLSSRYTQRWISLRVAWLSIHVCLYKCRLTCFASTLILSNGGSTELYFDTIIIGAGISGINAAYRLQTEGPADLSYVILEGRESLGGTWDLFRYPGIRSDSDIFTFGFPWSPWKHKETLASGDQIKDYMTQSARSAGIDHHICYRHSVVAANWCSAKKNWELQVAVPGEDQPVTFRSRFILLGTGYYDYETPLQTTIPGLENFAGKVIHPQFWPEDYDYTGKDVVVIGSGATAITIVPSMADKVKHITMLQRSPGYVFSLPSDSFLVTLLFTILPASIAHYLNRLVWLFRSYLTTLLCKAYPGFVKMLIKYVTIKQLPPDIKWDPNFKPRYNPWEQRFCACMNGDFFAALRSGKADVVTGTIKRVTEKSIELDSGKTIQADVIVTATGLKLRFGGAIKYTLDGQPINLADRFAWKSAMLQDVPNLLFMTGYESASWTLGADVSVRLFMRILRRIQEQKATVAVPRVTAPERMPEKPMMSLQSTYLKNAMNILPKGGTGVWTPKSNYFVDMAGAKWGNISTDLEIS
ncbi:hypothetical protein F5884DRAFT_701322 [Xylogone sp. PMI_703]|nr:hypothetical protein F5884DRAFT_701322 [Xylogone sp. PMI_703]